MTKQHNRGIDVFDKTLEDFTKEINGKDGDLLAIKSSSKMSTFCEETAAGIANFYREEFYPLSTNELKPFLKQITREFKKLFKEKK